LFGFEPAGFIPDFIEKTELTEQASKPGFRKTLNKGAEIDASIRRPPAK
jgi:hypothetical protein